MNKNKIIFTILSIIFLSGFSFVSAQEFDIPEPVCVPVHENEINIPCPNEKEITPKSDKNIEVSTQNKVLDQLKSLAARLNRFMDYFIASGGKVADTVMEGIRSVFDKLLKYIKG